MSDEPSINTGAKVQLCAECEKMVVLRDDDDKFRVAYEHGEPQHIFTEPDTWIYPDSGAKRKDEFPQLPGLLESSLKGCTFCKFLKEILESDQVSDFQHKIHPAPLDSPIPITYFVKYAWNYTNANERHYLVVSARFPRRSRSLIVWCTIQAPDDYEELGDWLWLNPPTHDLYTNDETVDWMRSRLNDCSEQHDCGAHLPKSDFLPDRLLDVQGDVPKLVSRAEISSSSQTNTRYLALSYCWGTKEDAFHQPKLTEDSRLRFQTGIDPKELSAVHRDTVDVARALSIPYIWIDSLCILQDDDGRVDWQRQCAQMDRIYGCAHVTILAGASSSCRQSFLRRPRGLQTALPFQSSVQPSRSGFLQLEVRRVEISDSSDPFDGIFHPDLNSSRLSTRGWAYQEQVLSARMILFGGWSVHYFCSDSRKTFQNPKVGKCRKEKHERIYEVDVSTKINRKLSNGDYPGAWEMVFPKASGFGSQSFTYPTDILPALSGLARLVQRPSPDVYLAGHWAQDLFRSLPWRRQGLTQTPKEALFPITTKAEPYTVPSWSILCKGVVKLVVVQVLYFMHIRSEVQSCVGEVTLVNKKPNADQYGAIESAQLEIRSHSFQDESKVDQSIAIERTRTTGWSVVIDWDSRRFLCIAYLDYHLRESDINQDPKMWRWVLLGSLQDQTRFDTGDANAGKDVGAERYPYGLLLLQDPGPQEKWYRVGVFVKCAGEISADSWQTQYSGVEDLTLDNFKEMSKIETITVL